MRTLCFEYMYVLGESQMVCVAETAKKEAAIHILSVVFTALTQSFPESIEVDCM